MCHRNTSLLERRRAVAELPEKGNVVQGSKHQTKRIIALPNERLVGFFDGSMFDTRPALEHQADRRLLGLQEWVTLVLRDVDDFKVLTNVTSKQVERAERHETRWNDDR